MKARYFTLLAILAVVVTAFFAVPVSAVLWYSKASFPEGVQNLGSNNTGNLVVEFDVTPQANGINGTIGYADTSTTVSGYSSSAAIVRMNTSGTFDVRNGAGYAATATVSYAAGNTYRIKLTVNMSAQNVFGFGQRNTDRTELRLQK